MALILEVTRPGDDLEQPLGCAAIPPERVNAEVLFASPSEVFGVTSAACDSIAMFLIPSINLIRLAWRFAR